MAVIKIDKIQPETLIYGALIIGGLWWLSKKTAKLSNTYNPFDSDNKVNQAAQAGVFTKTLKYSNPILAAAELGMSVAKKEYEFLKGLITR